jgi:hypothetical protein
MQRTNGHKKREVLYTDRQREVIRASFVEYYEFQHAGPRKASWGGICDEIFDDTKVCIEDFRQWATRFVAKGRKTPRRPNDECLKILAAFLMRPDIDMLLPEELKEPEIPHRFFRSFLELLHINPNGIGSPPQVLGGVYEAWYQEETGDIEEKWIKTCLEIEVFCDGVRATETSEVHFRGAGEPLVLSGENSGEGWGVVTPDNNIFFFMRSMPYIRNYYYITLATDPGINPVVIRNLAMLRHERPAICDPSAKSLEALVKETNGRTRLLNFYKSVDSNTGSGV